MRVALTWDDGPSEWTGPILDLLQKHGAKATFFILGVSVLDHEHLLGRMMNEGHEIGVHCYTHRHLPDITSQLELEAEFTDCIELLPEPATLWRAPYGEQTPQANRFAEQLGLSHVRWTLDTGDWCQRDARQIHATITELLTDQDIVLLHDGIPPDGGSGTPTRNPTVKALKLLLESHPHVEFVTVTDLAAKSL